MAMSRANAPMRQCARLLASSTRPFAVQSISRPVAPVRLFTTSSPVYKKRTIASPINSPKHHSKSAKNESSSSNPGPPEAPEDPLDMSSVTAAYGPIDAHFKTLLASMIHGGRFNPTNLGSLPVPVKDPSTGDASFPLRELAQVVPRSGRTISLLVHDKEYIKPIMSAVQSSREFNQQPQRSPDNELELLLKVELERKDDVVRRIKETVQQWRERIRQARTKHEKVLKEWKKTGVVLPDIIKKADKELQKVQDKKMKEIDQEEQQTIRQV